MPWKDYSILIVITSSTGDGDPPDNAIKFWREIRKMEGCLNHLDYALLGLGDTNYTNFCGFRKATKWNQFYLKIECILEQLLKII